MNIVFAGTPEFAAVALRRLIAGGHDIKLVLTRKDVHTGRGMRLTASPVSKMAEKHGIAVFKPDTLKNPEALIPLREVSPKVLVVAAYGLILPASVLSIPERGCLNIHASLLPRWRGAAPIHRAVEAGDDETGISIMQMDAGLDTGPVLYRKRLAIEKHETTATLTVRLSELGAEAIVEALAMLDELTPEPQDGALATYAKKVSRSEARIDWTQPAEAIERRMRAFDPFPGCETVLGREVLKVWAASAVAGDGLPGSILAVTSTGMTVATGAGALALQIVQRPGGRRLAIAEFLRAVQVRAGSVLGA